MTKIKRARITFQSGPDECVGYFFVPEGIKGPVACVVLGHGFTGTQDRLQSSAERFAAEGMAALTFDYRAFGESGGKPRQVISIKGQLEDFKNAIAFARSQPVVDPSRIGVWGSSLAGGYVITLAAKDPTIAAVVAQVPFNGFPKKVEGRSKEATNRLLGAMIKDSFRGMFGREPFYIKAVGTTGELAVMATPEAQKTIDGMKSDQWQNKVAPRVLFEMMKYKPGSVAADIKIPVMVCVATQDKETQQGAALAAGPRAVLKSYPVAHFEIYRPDIREQVLNDQATFFKKVLAA